MRLRSPLGLGPLLLVCAAPLSSCLHVEPLNKPAEESEDVFHVTAVRLSNSCGDEAFGTTPLWQFDLELSRADSAVQWGKGASAVQGRLSGDGITFALSTEIVVDMQATEATFAPCTVKRTDVATGQFSEAEDPASFSGTLGYSFTALPDFDCSELWMSEKPVVTHLPCEMSYQLSAVRAEAATANK